MTIQLALGVHQKIAYYISKLTPHNLLIQIDLPHTVTDNNVVYAIKAIFNHYPILGGRVCGQDDDLFFSCDPMVDAGRFIYRSEKNDSEEIKSNLNKNLQGDLLNIYLSKDVDSVGVIFIFDHVVVDKHSAHNIINQFLFFLDNLMAGEDIPASINLPLLVPPAENMFQGNTHSIKINDRSDQVFDGAQNSIVMPLSFDLTILRRLEKIKKQYGFSIHQIMAMCGLETLKKTIDVDIYTCTHLADLRRRQISNNDSIRLGLGILSASFSTSHTKSTIGFSNNRMSQVSEKITNSICSDYFLEELSFLMSILEIMRQLKDYSKILKLIKTYTPSVCVSSLGKVDLYQSKMFQVKQYFNAVTTHPFCGTKHRFLVLNYEFDEMLYVNLVASSPAWSEDEFKRLGVLFRENLHCLLDFLVSPFNGSSN